MFGFGLMNKKKFEIIFFKMVHLTYIVIFHFKMIIYQNINLSHNYEHHPEKINLWYDYYQIHPPQSHREDEKLAMDFV
jgi:hypothetical protein